MRMLQTTAALEVGRHTIANDQRDYYLVVLPSDGPQFEDAQQGAEEAKEQEEPGQDQSPENPDVADQKSPDPVDNGGNWEEVTVHRPTIAV